MKKIFLLITFSILIIECKSHENLIKEAQTYKNFKGFEPTDATEYNGEVKILVNNELTGKEIKMLSTEEVLTFLNNETVLVSIAQITSDGKMNYIPVMLSAKGSSYKITMDYMKFATLGQLDNNGKFLGYKRVGVGLRLISQVNTFESGINIGDISSIGIAAKAGKLNGTLMIEVIGIKSKEVTTLLPMPSEINQSTIQNAMQALATIKSKIYDSNTVLYPQVMAIKEEETPEKVTVNDKYAYYYYEEDSTTNDIINEVDNKVKLQFENNNLINLSSKSSLAYELMIDSFEFLFAKEIEPAINKLDECEKIFPTYLSVREINLLLKSNKESLKDKNSSKWIEIATKILDRYSWKLNENIKNQLKTMIGK